MKSQAKVKFFILLAIMVVVALFGLLGFQLYKIIQANKQISLQQQQISSLQKQMDYYENKLPNTEHDNIGAN